ncbi:hypothetical protein NX059_000902 [Plenodomus lindquistii]|nr:hypothetical protein NX059_000902 [Plenodomus lindquistii]
MNPHDTTGLPAEIADLLRTGDHLQPCTIPYVDNPEPLTAAELDLAADWDELYDILARIPELLFSARDLWD